MFSSAFDLHINSQWYASNQVQALLEAHQLGGFQQIWQLEAPWFEDPNERRAGVSGVVTQQLVLPEGGELQLFIKRQERHNTFSWRHPFRGIPTFRREFENIQRLQALGVPTIEVLYYGEAKRGGGDCAILVSKGLSEFEALEDWYQNRAAEAPRGRLWQRIAEAIRPFHERKIRHGCLYGKHIFVRSLGRDAEEEDFEVRLLDLEKAQSSWSKERAIVKDLSQLMRHTPGMTDADCHQLLSFYFAGQQLSGWQNRVKKAVADKRIKQRQKGQRQA